MQDPIDSSVQCTEGLSWVNIRIIVIIWSKMTRKKVLHSMLIICGNITCRFLYYDCDYSYRAQQTQIEQSGLPKCCKLIDWILVLLPVWAVNFLMLSHQFRAVKPLSLCANKLRELRSWMIYAAQKFGNISCLK